MTHSPTVVSRNGQVHARDGQTSKATGPLLGWVERDPENSRRWIAQSIAGGRIATEKSTRHEALRTLLRHVSEVQTPRLAATVDTGPIRIQQTGTVTRWLDHVGIWVGGIVGVAVLGLFAVALTVF